MTDHRVVEAVVSARNGSIDALVHTLPQTRHFERLQALLALSSTALSEARRILTANYSPDTAAAVITELSTIEDKLDCLLDSLAEQPRT